jgi:hypothetical protein
MHTSPPYDLVIGLDRSDKKADLCLIDTHTGQRRAIILDTAPEILWEWLLELRQQYESPTKLIGAASTTGRCWARQDSGDLNGHAGQRPYRG